jgi:hypothetical protein
MSPYILAKQSIPEERWMHAIQTNLDLRATPEEMDFAHKLRCRASSAALVVAEPGEVQMTSPAQVFASPFHNTEVPHG